MFVESLFEYVQPETVVQILEEYFPQMITFANDNGTLTAQVAETGKSGTEHRMGGDITEAALFIKFLQSGFYGSNVA